MTQRIVLSFFFNDSTKWTFFWTWLKELNFFTWNTTQRIQPFFFFLKYDSKNWFFWVWLNNWTLFDYDSKNWAFGYYSQMFLNMIQRFWFFHKIQWIEPFLKQIMTQVFWRKMTQRIELFFWELLIELFFLV